MPWGQDRGRGQKVRPRLRPNDLASRPHGPRGLNIPAHNHMAWALMESLESLPCRETVPRQCRASSKNFSLRDIIHVTSMSCRRWTHATSMKGWNQSTVDHTSHNSFWAVKHQTKSQLEKAIKQEIRVLIEWIDIHNFICPGFVDVVVCLQCFDDVGWVERRAFGL